MKKFLKILLIGVGGLFVLSIGLAVIGMASEEAPANDDTKVTQDAPTTAKESTPVTKDESSEKLNEPAQAGSVLLIRLENPNYIGGLIFENGDYVAIDGSGSKYKRLNLSQSGNCFAFFYPGPAGNFYKSVPFELQPDMIVFLDQLSLYMNFYVFKENAKTGIPVIIPIEGFGGAAPIKKVSFTVRNKTMVEYYTFRNHVGKEKIIKIPFEGAAIYRSFNDDDESTLIDSFGNPIYPVIKDDYSYIDMNSGKWEVIAPSLEVEKVELSKSTLQKILNQ